MTLRPATVLHRMLALLVAVGTLAGCDSAGEERSDAELILGSWTATRLQDGEGDRTSELLAAGTLEARFEAGTFALAFDPTGAAEPTTLHGTYTLQEEVKLLRLEAILPEMPGQPVTLPLNYGFRGENALDLGVDEQFTQVLVSVLGTEAPAFAGDVALTFERE